MGKPTAKNMFKKLSKELPPAKKMGWDANWGYTDLGMKIFEDDDDRNQFIHAVIAVATQNGLLDLEDHDLRLMYARRGENQDRVVARLVAVKDGVIKAKIEPQADGKDQAEAMKAFRKDVEVKLDHILQSIPSGSSSAAPGSSSIASPDSVEAPPAYSSGGVGIVDQKVSK